MKYETSPVMIAVLGFATECSFKNRLIAYQIGRHIAQAGATLVCGNNTSTFAAAFAGAHAANGTSFEIVTQDLVHEPSKASERLVLDSSKDKHAMLTEMADAAIVVGGVVDTRGNCLSLVAARKPVVAIRNSGGITRWELTRRVPKIESAPQAVNWVIQELFQPCRKLNGKPARKPLSVQQQQFC